MYLNVQNLLQLLNTLDPLSAHYLGKRSINAKIDVRERGGTEKKEILIFKYRSEKALSLTLKW